MFRTLVAENQSVIYQFYNHQYFITKINKCNQFSEVWQNCRFLTVAEIGHFDGLFWSVLQVQLS